MQRLNRNRFYSPEINQKTQKLKNDIIDRELFVINKIRKFEFITHRFIIDEFMQLFGLKQTSLSNLLSDMEKRGVLKSKNMKLINNGVAKFYFMAVWDEIFKRRDHQRV